MSARIAPAALRARLTDGDGELALLDVREQGAFARAPHPARQQRAAEPPRDRRAPPGAAARDAVVLCDGGDGLRRRAAAILARHGYSDLAVLEGGVDGWRAAGFTLFEGIHVPSKAFGEFVEATCGTPHVTAGELTRLAAAGRKLVILDSRPLTEYRQMSIPGGIDVPGAELVHRVRDLAPEPETLVVVNCAGRTRSIIGAQSLINAGVANPVVALENGTMGWTLAGQRLEHGQTRVPPPLTDSRTHLGQGGGREVGARFGVRTIGHDELARWRSRPKRARSTCATCACRRSTRPATSPGARCTPGGQLVQATDGYLGTRGARVVLVDDDGVRATMTASWLLQMGWRETYVLRDGLGGELERGPERLEVLGLEDRAIEAAVDPSHARPHGRERRGAHPRFRRQPDVPGRAHRRRVVAQPGQPAGGSGRHPPASAYVLTSPDGILARLALADVRRLVGAPAHVLAGGTEAWRAAGLPLQAGAERMAGNPDDVVYLRPYDRPPEQAEAAMRAYLQWETTLLSQLERDGTLSFSS